MKQIRPKWKTRDGQIIPVDLMSDNHLVNSLLMLEKRWFLLAWLRAELKRRPEAMKLYEKRRPMMPKAGWLERLRLLFKRGTIDEQEILLVGEEEQ